VPDERVQRVLQARVQRVQKQENSKRSCPPRATNRQEKRNFKQSNELNGKILATFSGK
jgi:hypothetical protein